MKRKQQAKGIRKIGLMGRAIAKQLVSGLLRFWYLLNRRRSSSARRSLPSLGTAGFVLPTVILVILILTLLVGALVIRSGERAIQVAGDRAASTVYNAATPAIERAKAKIEALMAESQENVRGVPNQEFLYALLQDGRYELPDETRLDLDGDKNPDNAWSYQIDLDGDGQDEVVRYSIAMLTQVWTDQDGDGVQDPGEIDSFLDEDTLRKAQLQITRSGPVNSTNLTVGTDCPIAELQPNGWFTTVGQAVLSKNFQVNAVVESHNEASQALTTLELQQDRQLNQGNFWAAWFRYDLQLTPGPYFRWNGAMHTEGNLLINNEGGKQTQLYLISSPFSCLYNTNNASSQITLADRTDANTGEDFQGQVVMTDADFNASFNAANRVKVFRWPGAGVAPEYPDGYTASKTGDNPINGESADLQDLNRPTDSVNNGAGGTSPRPYTIGLDPVVLFTEGLLESRYADDPSNRSLREPTWEGSIINERIFNENTPQPFVDDTYRADDRWGPQPEYGDIVTQLSDYGTRFDSGDPQDLFRIPPAAEAETAGLDGHWERRAFIDGLRIIVGQRLELGNPFGWRGPDDPLYPPDPADRGIPTGASTGVIQDLVLQQQRRTVRDNLAAVQATAVYHSANSSDTPVACIATTAHPGTEFTLSQSTDFTQYLQFEGIDLATGTALANNVELRSNFFFGRGTNGWEYAPPAIDSNAIADTTGLGQALRNLANFAGDPDGAFPPLQEGGTNQEHPDQVLTMWGNFSNLRRIFDEGTAFNDLSIADRSTLDTASCMLGMLADNMGDILSFDNANNAAVQTRLNGVLADILWDDVNTLPASNPNGKVVLDPALDRDEDGNADLDTDGDGTLDAVDILLPGTDLSDYQSGDINADLRVYLDPNLAPPAGTTLDRNVNVATLPDIFLTLLRQRALQPGADQGERMEDLHLAEVIHLKEQIERDRTSGFQPGAGGSGTSGACGIDGAYPAIAEAFCLNRTGTGLTELPPAQPKFPSLFYLFPVAAHGHTDGQPANEAYVSDAYISNAPDGVNSGVTYQAIDGGEINSIAIAPRDTWQLPTAAAGVNRIFVDAGSSNIPVGAPTEPLAGEPGIQVYIPFQDRAMFDGREQMEVRTLDIDLEILRRNQIGGEYWLPESEIVYAFREDAVREDAIERPRGDSWNNCNTEELITGIDPNTNGRVSNVSSQNTDSCRMRVSVPQDPPVIDSDATTATAGISPKPVDLYPDPDRRPHGFRLSNGKCLWRSPDACPAGSNFAPTNLASLEDDNAGLTFVSDNPVYIFGDFNIHTEEEFHNGTQASLADNWSNFYQRGDGTATFGELNPDFADFQADSWRRSAILADAITILSENFCSGTVESGVNQNNNFTANDANDLIDYNADPNCGAGTGLVGASSYRNSRWLAGLVADAGFRDWLRENPLDLLYRNNPNQATSPILFSSNGEQFFLYDSNAGSFTVDNPEPDPFDLDGDGTSEFQLPRLNRPDFEDTWYEVIDENDELRPFRANILPRVPNNYVGFVNAQIVSGIVPTRAGQYNGGLHNFPRFLENWSTPDGILRFSGSLIQLNFSTYATAPYEQENLNPDAPQSLEDFETWSHYQPPERQWGYDVALQYVGASPLARRFITIDNFVNEYYQEPPVDDPYIAALLNAN